MTIELDHVIKDLGHAIPDLRPVARDLGPVTSDLGPFKRVRGSVTRALGPVTRDISPVTSEINPVAEFIDHDRGDKVNFGRELAGRPARLHGLAGWSDNPIYAGDNFIPQSRIYEFGY